MIEIMNLHKNKITFPYDERIDRFTTVGNPFSIRWESERNEVCDRYDLYFYGENIYASWFVQNTLKIYKEYGKIRLFCWCAPLRCHGDTIKEYLEMCINEDKKLKEFIAEKKQTWKNSDWNWEKIPKGNK